MKQIKFILAFQLLLFSISCTQPKPTNCADFRTGSFKYYPKKTNIYYLINRTKSIQTETEMPSRRMSEWKIEWLSDCKYKLELINDNYDYLKKGNKPVSLTFELISTANEYYIFKQEFDLLKEGVIDTIWRNK